MVVSIFEITGTGNVSVSTTESPAHLMLNLIVAMHRLKQEESRFQFK
jgi:hypothetical protein